MRSNIAYRTVGFIIVVVALALMFTQVAQTITGAATMTSSGEWTQINSYQYPAGAAYFSNTNQSQLLYAFTGDSVSVSVQKQNDFGFIDVYVDGGYIAEIDLYSPHTEYNVVVPIEDLPLGAHTLKIVVTGRHNELSKGYYATVVGLTTTAYETDRYFSAITGASITNDIPVADIVQGVNRYLLVLALMGLVLLGFSYSPVSFVRQRAVNVSENIGKMGVRVKGFFATLRQRGEERRRKRFQSRAQAQRSRIAARKQRERLKQKLVEQRIEFREKGRIDKLRIQRLRLDEKRQVRKEFLRLEIISRRERKERWRNFWTGIKTFFIRFGLFLVSPPVIVSRLCANLMVKIKRWKKHRSQLRVKKREVRIKLQLENRKKRNLAKTERLKLRLSAKTEREKRKAAEQVLRDKHNEMRVQAKLNARAERQKLRQLQKRAKVEAFTMRLKEKSRKKRERMKAKHVLQEARRVNKKLRAQEKLNSQQVRLQIKEERKRERKLEIVKKEKENELRLQEKFEARKERSRQRALAKKEASKLRLERARKRKATFSTWVKSISMTKRYVTSGIVQRTENISANVSGMIGVLRTLVVEKKQQFFAKSAIQRRLRTLLAHKRERERKAITDAKNAARVAKEKEAAAKVVLEKRRIECAQQRNVAEQKERVRLAVAFVTMQKRKRKEALKALHGRTRSTWEYISRFLSRGMTNIKCTIKSMHFALKKRQKQHAIAFQSKKEEYARAKVLTTKAWVRAHKRVQVSRVLALNTLRGADAHAVRYCRLSLRKYFTLWCRLSVQGMLRIVRFTCCLSQYRKKQMTLRAKLKEHTVTSRAKAITLNRNTLSKGLVIQRLTAYRGVVERSFSALIASLKHRCSNVCLNARQLFASLNPRQFIASLNHQKVVLKLLPPRSLSTVRRTPKHAGKSRTTFLSRFTVALKHLCSNITLNLHGLFGTVYSFFKSLLVPKSPVFTTKSSAPLHIATPKKIPSTFTFPVTNLTKTQKAVISIHSKTVSMHNEIQRMMDGFNEKRIWSDALREKDALIQTASTLRSSLLTAHKKLGKFHRIHYPVLMQAKDYAERLQENLPKCFSEVHQQHAEIINDIHDARNATLEGLSWADHRKYNRLLKDDIIRAHNRLNEAYDQHLADHVSILDDIQERAEDARVRMLEMHSIMNNEGKAMLEESIESLSLMKNKSDMKDGFSKTLLDFTSHLGELEDQFHKGRPNTTSKLKELDSSFERLSLNTEMLDQFRQKEAQISTWLKRN